MARGDIVDHQLAHCPPWLLAKYGEALELALGLAKDAIAEGARWAVAQRLVLHCGADALQLHGRQLGIFRAPGETTAQYRERLARGWEAWRWAGTARGILEQLEPVGILDAEIFEAVSVDPSVASSWATWYLRVHEPHPFTPPITWGDGHTWDDGWLWGFGDDAALAYVRAVIRKWQPAHVLCTGVVVEFSSPATEVRLPVPWT